MAGEVGEIEREQVKGTRERERERATVARAFPVGEEDTRGVCKIRVGG